MGYYVAFREAVSAKGSQQFTTDVVQMNISSSGFWADDLYSHIQITTTNASIPAINICELDHF